MPIRREYVSSLYRDLLGREGSDQEIEGHLNNPGGESGLLDFFKGSKEYVDRHGGTQTWDDVGGVVTPIATSGAQDRSGSGDGGGAIDESGGDVADTGGAVTGGTYNPTRLGTGFMYDNFAAPQTQQGSTPKYNFARIATDFDPNPGGLTAMMNDPRFKAAFPNAQRVGKDGLYIPGVGTFDIGADFDDVNNTGRSWQWNMTMDASGRPIDGGGSGGGAGAGAGAGGRGGPVAGGTNLGTARGSGNFGGPGGPGVMNGPVQQVGQDDFSKLITEGLAGLILNEGSTTDGRELMDRMRAIIDSGGQLPNDTRMKRFESARELMAKGERTATNDARAALANRGLLAEPGGDSGAERSTIGRIQTRNAEEFARNLRDIGIAEDDAANTRLTQTLALATGMADNQARTLLATLGAGTDRQNMLSRIALENLQTNMAWNQFLAQFGLERDQAMYAIQNGQIEQLMPYIAMFLQLAQATTRGYV